MDYKPAIATLTHAATHLATQRAAEAVSLREAGDSFPVIARKLGLYDGSHARRVYLRGLAAQAQGERP